MKTKKIKFIVSADKKPRITLQPGMKLEVMSVTLADATLKAPKKVAARLCGGTTTCLALVDVEPEA